MSGKAINTTLAVAAVAAFLTSSPAAAQPVAHPDPFESFNRKMSDFNTQFYDYFSGSAKSFFSDSLSDSTKEGISNIFSNLGEPITAISSVFQGDFPNAGTAISRFAVNLTLGMGGYHDKAKEYGLESRREDLGQLVCSYGFTEGPYLVLPLYGPSTFPDIIGTMLPVMAGYWVFGEYYFAYRMTSRAAKYVGNTDGTDSVREDGIDDYTAERLSYLKFREAVCRNVPAAEVDPFELR